MLAFKLEDGYVYPNLTCDWCHAIITRAGLTLVAVDGPFEYGRTVPGAVLHKGVCADSFEAGRKGGLMWEELTVFLDQLAINVRIGEAPVPA